MGVNVLADAKTNESCRAGNETGEHKPAYEAPHELSHIKRVVAIMSGKGGVGKSSVTALLAVRMAAIMNIPIIGLVENMAYVSCPKCGEQIYAFGEPQGEKVAAATGVPLLATLPVDPYLSRLADTGKIEGYVAAELEHLPHLLEERLQHKTS